MIILHDTTGSSDLSRIQAKADINEGFALFDYVRVEQNNGNAWIGQIVQPNQNISLVGNRLDPTILHGLELMQTHADVQSVESVQIFDIEILGEWNGRQMTTARMRPLPGAVVNRLNAEDTCRVINLPELLQRADDTTNVIGELMNADNVPLCINQLQLVHHCMVAGSTGSGKSNAAANLIEQALLLGKCVLLHDAKPDYGLVHQANSDNAVREIWQRFENYGLNPHGAANVTRIGFFGDCDPQSVDRVVGFRASDFTPDLLAALFFPEPSEQLQAEAFASAADSLWQQVYDTTNPRNDYSLADITGIVTQRMAPTTPPQELVNDAVGRAVLRKVPNRQRRMRWLDTVGRTIGNQQRQQRFGGGVNNNQQQTVQAFDLSQYVQEGRLIVIDYSRMEAQSYALILSYFLRQAHTYRKGQNNTTGIVHLIDEAHRIFDNESRHSGTLARQFERVMREGRSKDHSIILSLQNASQVPPRVLNLLNTKVVMRQNSKHEADAATQTMGREFSSQSMRLGTGQALVSMFESRATVLAQMAPSPFELMRTDNAQQNRQVQNIGDENEF